MGLPLDVRVFFTSYNEEVLTKKGRDIMNKKVKVIIIATVLLTIVLASIFTIIVVNGFEFHFFDGVDASDVVDGIDGFFKALE